VKGNHSIKLGGNFQKAYTNSLRNNARSGFDEFGYASVAGYVSPTATDDPVTDQIAELLVGKADFANRNFGDTHRHIYQNSFGLYAQDDWKIKPRLTLTFGLRWDINGALSETNNELYTTAFRPWIRPSRARHQPALPFGLARLRAAAWPCLGCVR
jgi:outer membrane receptor protein involved in Fe transport